MPLKPFIDHHTPYEGKGELKNSDFKHNHFNMKPDYWTAWEYCWLARSCRIDTVTSRPYDVEKPGRFFAPNETNWTNYMMLIRNGDVFDVRVNNLTICANTFVERFVNTNTDFLVDILLPGNLIYLRF